MIELRRNQQKSQVLKMMQIRIIDGSYPKLENSYVYTYIHKYSMGQNK